jgi:large subunit ribosomal protein L15
MKQSAGGEQPATGANFPGGVHEGVNMQLHDLSPAPGSTKSRKRVGRGNASGHGTTAGRGDKGQNSRAGGGKGPGFEGGQNPLAMRLPKLPGFKNHWRQIFDIVNVGRLDVVFADGDVVDAASLKAKGVIKSADAAVKVLGDGELTKKLTVKVDKVSGSARSKIEAAGGTVE